MLHLTLKNDDDDDPKSGAESYGNSGSPSADWSLQIFSVASGLALRRCKAGQSGIIKAGGF